MSLIKKLITLDEAYLQLRNELKPIDEVIEVELRDSLGFVLAGDVYAKMDIPPFDRAAMDGFAVRFEDVIDSSPEAPVALKIIGESNIGKPFEGFVGSGEAVYVHTGSKIPDGANAVVPLEYTDVHRDIVYVRKSVSKGENISFRGEDVRAGSKILSSKTIIRPADIALMKSFGFSSVRVYRKIRIAVLAIGDELVDDPSQLAPGKILEYSREIPIGYLQEWGVQVSDFGIVPDDMNTLLGVIEKAKKNFDALVTVGGTSVGKYDLIPKLLSSHGRIIFHGLAVEPSKPVLFGKIDDFPIIGLPGLPVATFVSTITILREAITILRNSTEKIGFPEVQAILSRRVWSKPGIRTFVRVKLACENRKLYAEPIMISGASVLSSVVLSDGILVIPENLEGVEAGSKVNIIMIRNPPCIG